MKTALIFYLIFQWCSLQSFCQQQNVQNIVAEIGSHDIELGSESVSNRNQKKYADSFLNRQFISNWVQYINHQSYTVKYYAFMHILQTDVQQAYNVLQQLVADSTQVTPNRTCMVQSYKFNVLLAIAFCNYIKFSKESTQFCTGGYCFSFNNKLHKKEYKNWKVILKQLLVKHNIYEAVKAECYLY